MDYTSARLARLTHAHAAHELSQRLVAVASTHADGYGRGAFHTEEAAQVLSDAQALLGAAVVADRLHGCSWSEVGEALEVSKQSAHERFAGSEREFREALLFPDRQPTPDMPRYTVAPYAVQAPDQVREQLDRWVVKRRSRSGPERDEPEPVTRGLAAMRDSWVTDRMGEVLALSQALIDRTLPDGITYEQARRRHAELKVQLYERMISQNPNDTKIALALMQAREDLTTLDADAPAAQ